MAPKKEGTDMESYIQVSRKDMDLSTRFHEAGETLAATLHAATVEAFKSLGLVEVDHLYTNGGTANAVDLPLDMLINDRGHRPNARFATVFTVNPGSSDVEEPHPEIILGIQNWEAEGYRLTEDAERKIQKCRGFLEKLDQDLQQDEVLNGP